MRSTTGRRRGRLMFALPVLALGGVALAWVAGVGWSRLRILALELAMSAIGSLYTYSVGQAGFQRARRQRAQDLPWDVRLTEPLWMRADETALAIAIGGLLSAVPAALGFPTVSIGVIAALALFGVFAFVSGGLMTPNALTFEQRGLWTHFHGASVLVPWNLITHVQAEGPDYFKMLMLHISDRDPVLASVQPPTDRGRRRAEMALTGKRAGATLLLMPWTAGLDGVALERAIAKGRAGTAIPPALN